MLALQKILSRCELALLSVAIAATAAMMLLTSADAMGRYLFNQPIMGAYEITEKYLMVASIFLGLSYAFRGGVFIRVTFLVDRLPAHVKAITDHVAHILSILFCLMILFATAQQSWRGLSDDTTLSTLPILVGPAYCLVPIGFAALTIAMLFDLRRVRRGNTYLFSQDAPQA